MGSGGQKVILAPKLQNNILKNSQGGLGSSASGGIGSSSILNLPILGQENIMMPTNRDRGLKGIDSTSKLPRHEEKKIIGDGGLPVAKNSHYF